MNYSLDLYAERIYSHIEEKQNERRFIFAIVVAVLFHIVLFVVLNIVGINNRKQPDEIKIVNVRLHNDSPSASSTAKSSGKKVEQIKTTKDIAQTQNIKESQKDNVLNERLQSNDSDNRAIKRESVLPEKHMTKDISENSIEQPNDSVTEPVDIFAMMTQASDANVARNKMQWEEAHKQSNNEESQDDAIAKQIIENVNATSKDKSASGETNNVSDKSIQGAQVGKEDSTINWSSGNSRQLLSAGAIIPPSDIADKGLKASLTLKFEVLSNGLVSKVDVLHSSGDSAWDFDIAGQFKVKYKFSPADGVATGTIAIHW